MPNFILNFKNIRMKEKIFQSLKQAYSNIGLSDDIFQGHAEAY